MGKDKFVSIITAAKNSVQNLEWSIRSIIDQSFPDYEHVVIDGGSQDGTASLLQNYEKKYPLIWLSEPDLGIADALNKGIDRANGQYMIVIQADDRLYDTDTLARVHNIFQRRPTDICSFPVVLENPNRGNVIRKPIQRIWWNHFKFVFPHQGCFVHRRIFDKIGGFRTIFHIAMDYDFFYRVLKINPTITFGDFPVAFMGGEGISTSKEYMTLRLEEERKVQLLNENNRIWRVAQKFFHLIYIPYKLRKLKI